MDNSVVLAANKAAKALQAKAPPKIHSGGRRRGELLASAPLLDLLDEVRADTAALSRTMPNSDAHGIHSRFVSQLSTAIEESKNIVVWLRLEDVHDETGIPISSLTRWCRQRGNTLGARKVGGVWLVNWQTFESYLETQSTAREGK